MHLGQGIGFYDEERKLLDQLRSPGGLSVDIPNTFGPANHGLFPPKCSKGLNDSAAAGVNVEVKWNQSRFRFVA